jgi:nitrite reductase/ring-hydroxylating ferredoxin subunit
MQPDDHDCDACPIGPNRRDFLRDAALVIAGLAASVGMSGCAASTLPLSAMVPLSFADRLCLYPIPPADGATIDRSAGVILVRWKNDVYAFNLSCPHQNTALRWDAKSQHFNCPKHHSRYLPDGTFVDGRATRGMDRLGIAPGGPGAVNVNVDVMHKQDVDPKGWAAAVVHVA